MNKLNIKLFADGADLQSIIKLSQNDDIKGFTTNPTLMRKAGVQDYKFFAKDVLKHITNRPISFEVFADELNIMYSQAKEIASWGDNVYVKIPVTNTKNESTIPIIKKLANDGVKQNITALFTVEQSTPIIDILKNGPQSIISIFCGRIMDAGIDPIPTMRDIINYCSNISNIEVLWASPRCTYDIINAEKVGSHIITVSHDLLNKLHLFGKDLNEFSLETVRMFYEDSQKAGYKL
jgi:transaldolase